VEAVQLTVIEVAEPLVCAAETEVAAAGRVVAERAEEIGEDPATLTALIWNEYVVPALRDPIW
jgi:hypothetical protein